MIIEAKKFHSLLSANWRGRKASGILQSESKGLRTRGADSIHPCTRSKALELGNHWCKSQSPKAQEPRAPSNMEKKYGLSSLKRGIICPFALLDIRSIGWCPSILVKAGLFTQSTKSNANLPKIFSRHPEIMFYQLASHPLVQPGWLIKLTITGIL